MTALKLPQLKLEMDLTGTGPGTAPTYTDYSTYLRVSDGVQWQRGRQDERSEVTAGTASFAVNNDAGTFTGKQLRAPVRLSIRFDDTASYTVMWTGYVTGWERGWTSGVRPVMQVRAADAVMLLEKRQMPSAVRGEILADSPVAYWPLDDAAGSTVGTDRTGVVGAPSLTSTQVGTGGVLDFAAAAVTDPDVSPAAAFTPVDASNGKYLVPAGGVWPTGTAKTYECWFRTGTDTRTVLSIEDDYGNQVWVTVRSGGTCRVEWNQITAPGGSAQSSSSAVITDNAWHHVAYVETYSAGTVTGVLYVDGVDVGTDLTFTYTGWDSTAKSIAVGASLNSSTIANGSAGYAFDGAVAHVAVYASALSSARVAARYAAGTGNAAERSDLRYDRIGTYAATTVSTPSTGSATMGDQPIAGQTVWSVLNNIAFAEQGVNYISAAGVPTLAVRSQRYGAAVAQTFLARDIDPGTTFALDDTYLANDVTVTRPGGPAARHRNTASQTAYGTKSDTFEAFYDTDEQVSYLAQWLANIGATPVERIGALTIDATAKAATVTGTTLAALDVSDLVRITISATNYDLVVEGLQDQVGIGGWVRTLNVSPNPLSQVWLLDDSTYSLLDTTTVLGF